MQKNLKVFEDLKIKAEKDMVDRMKHDLADLLKEQPELNTTFHITRFLHARENDYEKAKTMFRKYLNFRKVKNITRIASLDMNSDKMKIFKDYYTAGHYGYDNEGRLVIIERVGFYDYKGMARDFSSEDLEDFFIQLQERILFIEMPILSGLFNKRIDRSLVILDLKNLKLSKLFEKKFRHFIDAAVQVTSNYYPEMLGKSVFINAPFGAQTAWNIIKNWMDPKTAAKFEMFSDNGHKYLSKLLNVENLPVEIGGQNVVSLQYGFGPFTDEIKKSYQRKSIFLADRELEYKWFYTEEEKKGLEKETQSTVASSEINREKMILSGNTTFGGLDKSRLNKSQKLNISQIRVNSYFTSNISFK